VAKVKKRVCTCTFFVRSRVCILSQEIWEYAEKLAAIFTIVGLGIGLWQYKENSQDQTKDITIRYLTGFSDILAKTDPILLDTINFFNNKSDSTHIIYNEYGELNKDTLRNLLQKHKEYRLQLDNIMVYLNQFAIGCKEGFYDEYTAWYSNHYRIINAVNALYPYIEIRAGEEHYDENKKPCGFLLAMKTRWRHKIGNSEKWEKNDIIESKKDSVEIQKWKNAQK
jgi:hypothetical protein